jgi:hypothetical protein
MSKPPPRTSRSIRVKDELWSWASKHADEFGYSSMGQLVEEFIDQRRADTRPIAYVRVPGEGVRVLPVTMVREQAHRLTPRQVAENRYTTYLLLDEVLTLPGVTRAGVFHTFPDPSDKTRYLARVTAEAVLPSSAHGESGTFEAALDVKMLAMLRDALEGKVVTGGVAEMQGRFGQRMRALGSTSVTLALVAAITGTTHAFVEAHVETASPLDDESRARLAEIGRRLKLHVE